MEFMQHHVGNVVKIYTQLPSARLTSGGIVDAEYVEEMKTLLGRRELQKLINESM